MYYARNYSRWILDEFREYIRGTTADIGCGTGNFLKLLLDCSPEKLIAIEPASSIFSVLKDDFGDKGTVELLNCDLKEVRHDLEGKLDAILYINVLEHVEHDREEIKLAFSCLKDNGHVCVFVPALQALFSNFDKEVGHYRRYDTRRLKELLSDAGFRIIKLKYFDFPSIIPWYITFKMLGKTMVGKQVEIYDTLVIPMIRLLERIIAVPLGKNALVVGRREA